MQQALLIMTTFGGIAFVVAIASCTLDFIGNNPAKNTSYGDKLNNMWH